MDDGIGWAIGVVKATVLLAGLLGAGMIGHSFGYNGAIEEAGKAACSAVSKSWVFMDGRYQCVTVTP